MREPDQALDAIIHQLAEGNLARDAYLTEERIGDYVRLSPDLFKGVAERLVELHGFVVAGIRTTQTCRERNRQTEFIADLVEQAAYKIRHVPC